MISQDVIQLIIKRKKALEEIKALLQSIAQEVEELDKDIVITPAEIDEEEGTAYWECIDIYPCEKKKNSNSDLTSKRYNGEEEEEYEDMDDDSDDWDNEEEKDEEITIGIYLWSPEPEKAVLSIYLEYSGCGDFEEDWTMLKQLKAKLGGKIHLYHDEWGEEKLEVERISLEELAQGKVRPEDIAKKVYNLAKKVCNFVED